MSFQKHQVHQVGQAADSNKWHQVDQERELSSKKEAKVAFQHTPQLNTGERGDIHQSYKAMNFIGKPSSAKSDVFLHIV